MKKEVIYNIEEDIVEKFNLAVSIMKMNCNTVIEELMKNVIVKAFSNVADEFSKDNQTENTPTKDSACKALHKIPLWAEKQTQIPYKIIRAFLQLEQENECVMLEQLEHRCSDEINHYDTYVKAFNTNFAQLKFDGAKSHGKVFVIKEGRVELWDAISQAIRNRNSQFLETHSTDIGYVNSKGQMNLGRSGRMGSDNGQYFYKIRCNECGYEYEANGSDIFLKKCPHCQGGEDSGRLI